MVIHQAHGQDAIYLPIYDKANWFSDGKETDLPSDFYSSEFLVDKTIEFIDSNKVDKKPFFAYIPFQAVHIPVQAPQYFTNKYMETYIGGWHALRVKRQENVKALGLVPQDSAMVIMSTSLDWSSQSDEIKRPIW